ncbi:MAG: SLBB domain-containing protein [Rubritepida sp.]|jgi:protein involved in polysaccharide export with SLBB domain|nr:SLBB domain-containing protein [Rubritepida sp.]
MRGAFAALLMAASPALAQQGLLAPPALPSTLPGGAPVPALPPGAQADILQRLLDAGAGRPIGAPQGAAPAQPLAPMAPAPPPAAAMPVEEAFSPVEQFFAGRLTAPLRQFGYDSFRTGAPMAPGFGAVPDDYVIGRDDEVIIAFRGRARSTLNLRVTREGMLILPDLMPIPAAGRTLRDLRAELEARGQRELQGTEVFVTLGQLRQVTVFVGGEVLRPGVVALSPLATVLDALVAAGGVRKTGTLRNVRVEGPPGSGQPRRTVDLYPLIAGEGTPPDISLREGERILVPPIGGVVAIGGEVSRPAIYELPPGAASAPLGVMLRFAGDALRPEGNRFLLETTDGGGRRAFREIGLASPLRRGDALLVQPGSDVQSQQIRLSGHVAQPTTRALGGGSFSLRRLLADARIVRPDPYARMGVVLRVDARTRGRRFQPFDLAAVLQGRADIALAEGDDVIILALSDIAFLSSPSVQRALRGEADGAAPAPALPIALPQPRAGLPGGGMPGGTMPGGAPPLGTPPGFLAPGAPQAGIPQQGSGLPQGLDCPALTQVAVAARSSPQRFAHARVAGFPDIGALPCPQIFLDYPALLTFLLDQAVLLIGEVRQPGLYPILDNTGLEAVLAVAGGVTDTADLSVVELSREPAEQSSAIPLTRTTLDLRSRNFAAVRLSPRDSVRFPRGFGDRDAGPVTLVGEFLRPGVYDIRRGERLSQVIARAGGLTPQAYPYGAVFTRESVRNRQQEGFQRTARELEQGLLQVAAAQAVIGTGQRGAAADIGGAIAAGREMSAALREARAAGRMVVEANPVVLAGRPELDVLLEPGDLIVMPKRPNEVTVVGAVQNPGSLQFSTGWRASQYVTAAGGTLRFADPGRAFIILPNGQAVPAGLGAWQQGGPPVPPGSLVIVPNDPSPFERWAFLRDITQVVSQLAISAAALAVIANNQ